MKTITLKNIPDTLHQTYRERAQRHARSLNREILQTLEQAASDEIPDRKSISTRIQKRVARQAVRQKKRGEKPLKVKDYLEAIQEGRE